MATQSRISLLQAVPGVVRGCARSVRYALRAALARRRPGRPKCLLIAWYDPRGLSAIRSDIESIRRMSRLDWDVLNLYMLPPFRRFGIPAYVKLADYDALMVHCTVSYSAENLWNLDANRREKLADFRGLKVCVKQDEQYKPARVAEWLREAGVHLLLTCLPTSEVRKVYTEEALPDLRFVHVLTGYVTPGMREMSYPQDESRAVDIGYRGSSQPFAFGRLAYEKAEIGEFFERLGRARGLRVDISSRWEDRFTGRRWFDFLGRCKATLGVESGASVFDFDGTITARCEQYLKEHPEADFEEVYRRILAPHEGRIQYGQISPRHFEAAACRTAQIMYEGRYSDIFEPWRHFFPLARDKSNVDEVLERALNLDERRRVTDNAFREIILSDRWLYSGFVQRLDEAITEMI